MNNFFSHLNEKVTGEGVWDLHSNPGGTIMGGKLGNLTKSKLQKNFFLSMILTQIITKNIFLHHIFMKIKYPHGRRGGGGASCLARAGGGQVGIGGIPRFFYTSKNENNA